MGRRSTTCSHQLHDELLCGFRSLFTRHLRESFLAQHEQRIEKLSIVELASPLVLRARENQIDVDLGAGATGDATLLTHRAQ
jgi:hypothetical protein